MGQKKKIHEVDTVIVGAGPSGLLALSKVADPSLVSVLEAEDRLWGRLAHGALHLVRLSEELPGSYGFANIKWEREWIEASEFSFDSKEWAYVAPQWQHYIGSHLRSYDEFSLAAEQTNQIQFSTPISQIERDGECWTLVGPESIYRCRQVIWSAGIESFQNAYGKEAAREFLVANPRYNPDARETMGGVALNWNFQNLGALTFVSEGVPMERVLLVPVKHNKFYYLSVMTFTKGDDASLRTITYLPVEILKHPKEVLSFQKSLRRVMKSLFVDGADIPHQEVMIQSSKLCGHGLGLPWVLVDKKDDIEFVGDETLASVSGTVMGLASLGDVPSPLASASDCQDVMTLTDAVSPTAE